MLAFHIYSRDDSMSIQEKEVAAYVHVFCCLERKSDWMYG
jgi:hypothetical protein